MRYRAVQIEEYSVGYEYEDITDDNTALDSIEEWDNNDYWQWQNSKDPYVRYYVEETVDSYDFDDDGDGEPGTRTTAMILETSPIFNLFPFAEWQLQFLPGSKTFELRELMLKKIKVI
jgi:hypothetical protein